MRFIAKHFPQFRQTAAQVEKSIGSVCVTPECFRYPIALHRLTAPQHQQCQHPVCSATPGGRRVLLPIREAKRPKKLEMQRLFSMSRRIHEQVTLL